MYRLSNGVFFQPQVTSKGRRSRSNPKNFEVKYLKNLNGIERKCQYKLGVKSFVGFQIVKSFSTPGDLLRSRSNSETFEVENLKNGTR